MEETQTMTRKRNKKKLPNQNPENADPGEGKTKETDMDIKSYLQNFAEKLKTEILNQVKQDISRLIKAMLSISQEDTNRRREEHKKERNI